MRPHGLRLFPLPILEKANPAMTTQKTMYVASYAFDNVSSLLSLSLPIGLSNSLNVS